MRTVFFVVILCLAALARAQMPQCNMFPAQITAGISILLFDDLECTTFMEFGMIYVDYEAQMTRADLSFQMVGGQSANISAWINYNEGIEYVLDQNTGECESVSYTGPPSTNMFPPQASYLNNFMIGSQSFDAYYVSGVTGVNNVQGEFTVTTGSCYPGSAALFNTSMGTPMLIFSEALWNVVNSVPAYIFDVPNSCFGARSRVAKRTLHPRFRHPKIFL